ncbi:MAG: DNA repair protein RecN [Oscillospiraceae bacterium]|nr:DNA repair protein RecN [Oscillospiraceae bacterium]
MLSLLHIENIAVIEQADIGFDHGFNVLTGETGAGKSIVIDAISAILGERTYRDVIRTGSSKGFVSAVFTGIPVLPWFEENRVDYDPDELMIQREIHLDGKNVCRVNGRPVTVAILRRLGQQLISIHGQHDSQQLFDEATHLGLLDLYAHDEELLADYIEKYQKVLSIRREIERLSMDESEKLRRMEMLRHQIGEIERAELKPGEDTELESRRKLLQNAEKLSDGLIEAFEAINGDDSSDGAAALLTQAERALARIARYDESIDELHEKAADLMYQVMDLAEVARDLRDSLAFSGDELEKLEDRLDVIHKLRRKYGATVEDILEFLETSRTELDEIEFAGDRLEQLKKDCAAAEKKAAASAMLLRKARLEAAEDLQQRIRSELEQLDMPKVQFVCQFEETELGQDGMDSVRFLMSANVGEALKPLSKVASGGELARIMLAMKNVMAEQDSVPTLIFDEVDAGVSGRAAQKVAVKLRSVSANKQVLCVTHLPQIAAMADTHLLISKAAREGRTYTSVTPLDKEGRINEIARIIGGAVITDTTRKSAEEMLHA